MLHDILGFSGSVQENLLRANSPEHFEALRNLNISQTRKDIALAQSPDFAIVQEVSAWKDIAALCDSLTTRLREWYSLYDPERSHSASDQKLIDWAEKCPSRQDTTMGANFTNDQLVTLKNFATRLRILTEETNSLQSVVMRRMDELAPNLAIVATPMLGAQILAFAGSLRALARLPSSTIQLIGAEKALFRHMVTGSKCPKHGILIYHPLVQTATNKGKAASVIAGKIAIAARLDSFGGELLGHRLLSQAQKRLFTKTQNTNNIPGDAQSRQP